MSKASSMGSSRWFFLRSFLKFLKCLILCSSCKVMKYVDATLICRISVGVCLYIIQRCFLHALQMIYLNEVCQCEILNEYVIARYLQCLVERELQTQVPLIFDLGKIWLGKNQYGVVHSWLRIKGIYRKCYVIFRVGFGMVVVG
jgi:hypothetical protein